MTKVGERLKKIREETGLSQRDVAQAASISQSTYSDLERGDSAGRSLEILGQVAKGIGVSADYLLGIEKDLGPKVMARGSLSTQERELLSLWREVRPKTRRSILSIVRVLHSEEAAWREDLVLLEQIEELDKYGLFEKAQARLFELTAELGNMRAAFAALKEETKATFAEIADSEKPDAAG